MRQQRAPTHNNTKQADDGSTRSAAYFKRYHDYVRESLDGFVKDTLSHESQLTKEMIESIERATDEEDEETKRKRSEMETQKSRWLRENRRRRQELSLNIDDSVDEEDIEAYFEEDQERFPHPFSTRRRPPGVGESAASSERIAAGDMGVPDEFLPTAVEAEERRNARKDEQARAQTKSGGPAAKAKRGRRHRGASEGRRRRGADAGGQCRRRGADAGRRHRGGADAGRHHRGGADAWHHHRGGRPGHHRGGADLAPPPGGADAQAHIAGAKECPHYRMH